LIDVLLAESLKYEGTLEWMTWVAALSGFRDQRVTQFFVDVIATAEEPTMLFVAAGYLADVAVGPWWPLLTQLFHENDCPLRVRALGPIVSQSPQLTPAGVIRVSLINESSSIVEVSSDNIQLWKAELLGPFAADARGAFETQGEVACRVLLPLWNDLAEWDQVWLVQWSANARLTSSDDVLLLAIESDSHPVLLEALHALSILSADASPRVRQSAARLADHPDAAIRAAAIGSGIALDWLPALTREQRADLRCAILRGIPSGTFEPDEVTQLLACLRDSDWRVRADAVGALGRGQKSIASLLKPLIFDSESGVRIAAVQGLLHWGEDDWLQGQLLPHEAALNS
jgi:hypothetical protein